MEVIEKNLKEFKNIDNLLEKKQIFKGSRLFKCILGLNKTESQVFGYLLKSADVSTSELTQVSKMDRSSIQRAVQNLSELKLIKRKSMSMKEYASKSGLENTKKQGYLYVYNVKHMELIKIQFKKLLDKWYSSMSKYIENLENLCECCDFKFEPC